MESDEAGSATAGSLDALMPGAIARACEAAGVAKSRRDAVSLIVLGGLAGAFIAFGAVFMTVVLAGSAELPWGVARLLAGIVFSLGLILVIASGAELFTGDALMIVACASRRISVGSLLRAWSLVYLGNVGGAVGMALLVFFSGTHEFGGGAIGRSALAVAAAKSALPTLALLLLAVLCNVLVCLAVWMSFGGRSIADKVVVIVPPIAAFVAAGFEHSIANLYLLPYGLLIKAFARDEFWIAIESTAMDFPLLTVAGSIHNVAVATLGNLLGGSLLVGLIYWFVYLRPGLHPAGRRGD